MIFVKYQEKLLNPATGAISHVVLGSELHQDIEEVLLPATSQDPIFFTKKFVGHPEHRWEVTDVVLDPAAADRTYVITLQRRDQLDKLSTQIRGAVRTELKDAMMYGVAAGGRVQAAQSLAEALAETAALQQQVANLISDTQIYQRWAADSRVTMDELRQLYP